jgi:hypothetical protein
VCYSINKCLILGFLWQGSLCTPIFQETDDEEHLSDVNQVMKI